MNYEELEKLNEMKEKGIITDEEFQREKNKFFNKNNSEPQVSNFLKTENTFEVKKDDHTRYKMWSSIILMVLGLCLMLNTGDDVYGNSFLVFTIPGILGVVAGVLKLANKNNDGLLFVAGVCSIVATVVNTIGILDLSIYGILGLIFGIYDIKYSKEQNY